MEIKRKEYLRFLDLLTENTKKAGLPVKEIALISDAVKNMEFLIPVVGEFSSGKSAFLNRFIERKELLPEGISPETAIAAALYYSPEEKIEAIHKNNPPKEYALEDIKNIPANEFEYLKVYINSTKLKNIEPLVLVDMPGFSSSEKSHSKAIRTFLDRGIHYIVLVRVDDGTFTSSLERELLDIQEFGADFTFFLSRTDSKPESFINEVAEECEERIFDIFDVEKTIHRLNNSDDAASLLKIMNALDVETLFKEKFLPKIREVSQTIIESIDLKIGTLQANKVQTENAAAGLNKNVERIQTTRDRLIENLRSKTWSGETSRVLKEIENALNEHLDSLVDKGLSSGGEAINAQIEEIVQHIFVHNFNDFSQEIVRSFGSDFSNTIRDLDPVMRELNVQDFSLKLQKSVASLFDRSKSFVNSYIEKQRGQAKVVNTTSKIYKGLTSILAITTTLISPILEVLIVFLPEIVNFLTKKDREEKQKNELRKEIVNIIPQIKLKLKPEIEAGFKKHAEEILIEISSRYDNELQEALKEIEVAKQEKSDTSEIEQSILTLREIKSVIHVNFSELE